MTEALTVNIHPKYQVLWHNKSRYYIVTGGRGSGKSFGVAMFLLNLTYERGHKVLFTRYTMMSAQTSIIPEFIEKIEMMGVTEQFRITKDEIINLETGSSIIFKGIRTSSGNQTAALKSLNGVTTFVLDESEELVDEEVFDKIDFSVRSQLKQNRCILILNPTTKEHWIYQRFFLPNAIVDGYNGEQEGITFIHTDYRDNKENLSASFINQVEGMKRERPDKYEHIILGGWLSKAEGAIIRNWRVGDYLQLEKTVYCQDFGFSKDLTTLVKLSVDKENRRLYVREIFGKAGLSTSEIARLNKAECGLDLIIGDSSEPRLINELKALDINIKPTIKKKGSILSGIALMQDYEIIVDRSSKGIMKEFNNYVWQDKNEKPIDSYNHFCDAIRYGLQYLIQGSNSGNYVVR
jgi:phage terminase large subunit